MTDHDSKTVGTIFREHGDKLSLLVVLVPLVPIVVAVTQAITGGWMPVSDNGWQALQIKDVFSTTPPRLGNALAFAGLKGHVANSPGPMLFWGLAPFYRFSGWAPWGLLVGGATINIGSVLGVAIVARRRGGAMLLLWSMLLLAVMLWALRGQPLRDIWNAHIPILAFTLLLFATWAVSCGSVRALPVVVLTASFIAQAHVSYLGFAFALGLWALIGFTLTLRDERRRLPIETWQKVRRRGRKWCIASVGVGLMCWILPLVDQFFGYGNLGRLLRTNAELEKDGLVLGAQRFANTFGPPPFWTRKIDQADAFDTIFQKPGALQWIIAVGAVMLLGLLLQAMRKRRRRQEIRLIETCLASFAIGIWSSSQAPAENIELHAYRWVWPVGMFCWLTIGWSTYQVVRPRLSLGIHNGVFRSMAVGAVALTILGTQQPPLARDTDAERFRIVSSLSDLTLAKLPDDGPYLVEVSGEAFFSVGDGVRADLERHGVDIRVVDARQPPMYGKRRTYDGTNAKALLVVTGGRDIKSAGKPDELLAFISGGVPGYRRDPTAGYAVFLMPLPGL